MNAWLLLRLGIIATTVMADILSPPFTPAKSAIGWDSLVAIFVACVIGMPLVLLLQRFNVRSAKVWSRPSWTANPLNLRDPVQFFHLAAWISITAGLIGVTRAVITLAPVFVAELVPLALGAGVRVGIAVAVVLYASKFASAEGCQ